MLVMSPTKNPTATCIPVWALSFNRAERIMPAVIKAITKGTFNEASSNLILNIKKAPRTPPIPAAWALICHLRLTKATTIMAKVMKPKIMEVAYNSDPFW